MKDGRGSVARASHQPGAGAEGHERQSGTTGVVWVAVAEAGGGVGGHSRTRESKQNPVTRGSPG